jgi:hypothetical protein
MLRKDQRAVSLIEGVLTLFLFAVVLSAVGSLLTDASRLFRRAEELSWANQASDWLNLMEADLATAFDVALATGGADTKLKLDRRDLDSPDFLPDSPPGSWSLDDVALQVEVVYSLSSDQLNVATTPNAGSTTVVDLGEADTLTVERASNGNFRLTLSKGQERLRREVPALCVDSLAAPL